MRKLKQNHHASRDQKANLFDVKYFGALRLIMGFSNAVHHSRHSRHTMQINLPNMSNNFARPISSKLNRIELYALPSNILRHTRTINPLKTSCMICVPSHLNQRTLYTKKKIFLTRFDITYFFQYLTLK